MSGMRGGRQRHQCLNDVQMIRRIFSLATMLSLLLCAASVTMWIGSYRPGVLNYVFKACGGEIILNSSEGYGSFAFRAFYSGRPVYRSFRVWGIIYEVSPIGQTTCRWFLIYGPW